MNCSNCGALVAASGDCPFCDAPFAGPHGIARYASPNLSADGAAHSTSTEDVIAELVGMLPASEIEAHLGQLPATYRLRTPAAVIGQHIALIGRAAGGSAIDHRVDDDTDLLTVATSDRPGVLAQLAGALAARGVNILGGSAFTRDDGIAIDVLRVESLAQMDDGWWDALCEDIGQALDDPALIEPALGQRPSTSPATASVPTTVYVDNDPASEFTKVEVNSVDRVGLLYALTRAISSCGIDIHLASVDTAGPLAVDTFYVRGADGDRVEDVAAIEQLKETVIAAVARLDP